MESKKSLFPIFTIVIFIIAIIYIERIPKTYSAEEQKIVNKNADKQKFRTFWDVDDNNIYHLDDDFMLSIDIIKISSLFGDKGTFRVFFANNYPAYKSTFVKTYKEIIENKNFNESKGIWENNNIEKIYNVYQTTITFKDGENVLSKNVDIYFSGSSEHDGRARYECDRRKTSSSKYDELLLFLVNAKNDNVLVELKDEKGNIRQHEVYVKGLKEWINSKKDVAYFMGYEN